MKAMEVAIWSWPPTPVRQRLRGDNYSRQHRREEDHIDHPNTFEALLSMMRNQAANTDRLLGISIIEPTPQRRAFPFVLSTGQSSWVTLADRSQLTSVA